MTGPGLPDLEIRRCTVHLVRRSGWSWGPDPRGLAEAAVRTLPGLVARAIAGRCDDGADVEVREPVRVRIAARRRPGGGGRSGPGVLGSEDALAAAVETAVEEALREIVGPRPSSPPDPAPEVAGPEDAAPVVTRTRAAARRLLLSWHLQDRLGAMLETLGDGVVEHWHVLLLPAAPASQRDADPRAAAVRDAVERALAARPTPPGAGRAARLRARLAVAAAVAACTGTAPEDPLVRREIDRMLPVTVPGHGAAPAPPPVAARSRPPDGPPRPAGPRPVPADGVRLASALPFLLLGTLSATGWLECAATTFAVAGAEDLLPALAAAVAHKVLGPPHLGWSRSAEDVATVSAFAGPDAAAEGRAARLARLAPELAGPLEATLGAVLADGHTAGHPLLACSAPGGSGWVLFDVDGLFPMAWGHDRDALRARAAALVPGAPVVEDHGRADEAGEVLAALAARPADPQAPTAALDRCATLAAGVALADLAWTLWREREPTDPLLALTRFEDLSATVRWAADRVEVRLPLGPRSADLARHGLLPDVADVPWLGGRRLVLEA